MKQIRLLFLILLAAIISAGTFYLIKNLSQKAFIEVEKKDAFDPSSLIFKEATSSAPWPKRDSHVAVVFKDKIWLMGGLNGNGFVIKKGAVEYWKAPHLSDVWVSENGKDWEMITGNAPWGERRSIQVVSFKDRMWLMGGWGPKAGYKNDVWYSEDGVNWAEATSSANWPAREGHSLVVFNDKLWLIGGVMYDKRETKNDVWYSEDGINWFQATSSAQWLPRWDHAVTVFKDKLWLIGGMNLNGRIFKDAWSSQDGKNWVLTTDNPPWGPRQGHNILDFKDKLWLVGRFNDISNGGDNDVWYSEDGVNWEKTKNSPLWSGREDFSAIVFKDKIWILGGMDVNWEWTNDIWYSTN
jgi:leucine-zipper-like transcriptional regulator 1